MKQLLPLGLILVCLSLGALPGKGKSPSSSYHSTYHSSYSTTHSASHSEGEEEEESSSSKPAPQRPKTTSSTMFKQGEEEESAAPARHSMALSYMFNPVYSYLHPFNQYTLLGMALQSPGTQQTSTGQSDALSSAQLTLTPPIDSTQADPLALSLQAPDAPMPAVLTVTREVRVDYVDHTLTVIEVSVACLVVVVGLFWLAGRVADVEARED